jgi:hypothetical protein
MNDHAHLDARSLAYHQAIAAKLLKQPDLVERAKANLVRWREQDNDGHWMTEWAEILALPIDDIARFLCDPSERATRLRQSSPFPGILTVQERVEIFAKFKRNVVSC